MITAIRWPQSYDGRYDDQIKTIINIFPFVLASLAEEDSSILEMRVADDVFTQGSGGIQRIMKNGNIQIPAEHFSAEQMQQKYLDQQKKDTSID